MQVAEKSLPGSQKNVRLYRRLGDAVFHRITQFFAFLILLLVLLTAYEMIVSSTLSIGEFGPRFITSSVWDPVLEEYGALPFIYGTLVTSFLAILIAVPLSIGIAVFLSELAPRWLERPVSFFVELLAAIPSIVYGLWGFFVMVPWLRTHIQPFLIEEFGFLPFFQGAPYGIGMLSASVILSIMILPIIASISRDVLRTVPNTQREAALGLGSTGWEATRIAISYSRSGILGASILALGRALGETMAVTMVIGNRPEISFSLMDPAHTMASVLANEFTEATTEMYLSALTEIALILFVITLVVNAFARLLVWSVTKRSEVQR